MNHFHTATKRVAGLLATAALALSLASAPANAANGQSNGNGGPNATQKDTGWGP